MAEDLREVHAVIGPLHFPVHGITAGGVISGSDREVTQDDWLVEGGLDPLGRAWIITTAPFVAASADPVVEDVESSLRGAKIFLTTCCEDGVVTGVSVNCPVVLRVGQVPSNQGIVTNS